MNTIRCSLILLTVAIAVAARAEWQASGARLPTSMEKYIADLGSPQYSVREAAMKGLEAIGEQALEALEKVARDSNDAEVRQRASLIRERIIRARQVASYRAHKFAVSSLAFSDDGNTGLSAGCDGGVAVFTIAKSAHHMIRDPWPEPGEESREERGTWLGRLLHGCRAKFGTRMNEIFVADKRRLSILNTKDKRVVAVFAGSDYVSAFSVGADGEVTGYAAGILRRWDNHNSPAEDTRAFAHVCGFSGDGTKVALCLGERMVYKEILALPPPQEKAPAAIALYETRKLTKQASFLAGSLDFRSCALSRTGRWLLTGHADGCVRLWDIVKKKEVRRLEKHSGGVRAIAISSNDTCAFTGDEKGLLCFWDVQSGKLLRTFQNESSAKTLQPEWFEQEGEPRGISSVAISPNGELAASGARDGVVRVWALPKRKGTSP